MIQALIQLQQVAALMEFRQEKVTMKEHVVVEVVMAMEIVQEKVEVNMETAKEILFQMHQIELASHHYRIPPHLPLPLPLPFLFSIKFHYLSALCILQPMLQPSFCLSQSVLHVQPPEPDIDLSERQTYCWPIHPTSSSCYEDYDLQLITAGLPPANPAPSVPLPDINFAMP